MEAHNIDAEGLNWNPIDNKEQCDESMEYLSDNNLIIPSGTWYETALNNSSDPEGPIQIYKNEDGKTILSAYLKCNASSSCSTVRGFKIRRADQEVAYDSGNIRSHVNSDGKFVESEWCTPPGETGVFVAKSNKKSDRPSGCYVNLGETSKISGQGKNRTGSLWFTSTTGTGAKGQRPVVCQSPITDRAYSDENTNLAYIN